MAGTDNDTTNLSMLATARRMNPKLFLAARQNRPTSAALFEAMRVDALLVPTEVVAHEVYAQISTPLLWRFIQGHAGPGRRLGGRAGPAAAAQLRRRAAGAVEGQAGRRRRRRRSTGRLGDRPGRAGRPAAQPGGPGAASCEVVPLLLLRAAEPS